MLSIGTLAVALLKNDSSNSHAIMARFTNDVFHSFL